MTTRIWSSPRGTACIELDANASIFRFESDREWLEEIRKRMRRVAMLDSDVALALEHDSIDESGRETILVARFAPARMRRKRIMPMARAASFVTQLAELVQAHHAEGGEGALGPFDPELIVETDDGDKLIAPGMLRITQQHDSNMRGLRGGTLVRHCRVTHDELRGGGGDTAPGLPDDVNSLAVLFIELVSGKEPYPTASEWDYMNAVVQGAHLPLDALLPKLTPALRDVLAQALRTDASARPTLPALSGALLAEPGVVAHPKPSPELQASAIKPWWKIW